MAIFRIRSDFASSAGRAAHDLALAALLGGNLFGRVAMGPSLEEISEESERGRVLNRAWRRYGTVNSVALMTLVASWLPARLNDTHPRRLSDGERRLAVAKDVAVGAVIATGLASAASGVGFAKQAAGGAIPMESGMQTASQASPRASMLKGTVNVLGALNLFSEVSLAAINAATSQTGFRRPPARRVLRRRY